MFTITLKISVHQAFFVIAELNQKTVAIRLVDGRGPLGSTQATISVKHSNRFLDVYGIQKTKGKKL